MSTEIGQDSFYVYEPSRILPIVFGTLTAISFAIHVYQNNHYKFWRITFFVAWAGLIWTAGWFVRLASTFNHVLAPIGSTSAGLYIAQTCLIVGGPPLYAAVEYCVLGRMLHYLPYYAPLHPHRVYYFFVYIGALIESLTAAGGAMFAANPGDIDATIRGRKLLAIALVLQAVLQLVFCSVVWTVQRKAARRSLPKNVSRLCWVLYGTSILIIFRSVFRAIEGFASIPSRDPNWECTGICRITSREWWLYAFEAAPIVLFSFWLNIMHPAKYLPHERLRYLDLDGRTERYGPGWIDRRNAFATFMDPFDITGRISGKPSHEKFWDRPEDWPEVKDGSSFALGTASNSRRGRNLNRTKTQQGMSYEGVPLSER